VKKILVVDDERQIRRALGLNLTARDYHVVYAGTGETAMQAAATEHPDLVLLDLGLPGLSGIGVIEALRGWSKVPIIVLTARDAEYEKITALEGGADDYVTKPFGMDELLARIRATLRRQPAKDAQARIFEVADFRIDLDAHVASRGGEELRLTPKEFDLLAHLMRNAGKVLTHRALLGAVWGGDYTEQHEYLRVFIGQLRKKIEPDPSKPRYIVTEPWIGYRFNPE